MGPPRPRDRQARAPPGAAPALRPAAGRAHPPHPLRDDEPALGGPALAGGGPAVRPRDLRRGLADRALGRHRRHRAGTPDRDRGRPRATAPDQRRRARGRRGRPRRARPGEHPRRVPGRPPAAAPPRLALPQPAREPDRVLEPALLSRRPHHLPVPGHLGSGGPPRAGGGRPLRTRGCPGEPPRGAGGGGRGAGAPAGGCGTGLPRNRHLQRRAAAPDREPARRRAAGRSGSGAPLRCPPHSRAGLREEPRDRAGRRARRDPVLGGGGAGRRRADHRAGQLAQPERRAPPAQRGDHPGAARTPRLHVPAAGADRPRAGGRRAASATSSTSSNLPPTAPPPWRRPPRRPDATSNPPSRPA